MTFAPFPLMLATVPLKSSTASTTECTPSPRLSIAVRILEPTSRRRSPAVFTVDGIQVLKSSEEAQRMKSLSGSPGEVAEPVPIPGNVPAFELEVGQTLVRDERGVRLAREEAD